MFLLFYMPRILCYVKGLYAWMSPPLCWMSGRFSDTLYCTCYNSHMIITCVCPSNYWYKFCCNNISSSLVTRMSSLSFDRCDLCVEKSNIDYCNKYLNSVIFIFSYLIVISTSNISCIYWRFTYIVSILFQF